MPAHPKPHIGENIRRARESKGFSQDQLARALGHEGENVGAHISRIEKGHTQPRVDTIQAIADALRVDMRDLLETRVRQQKA